MKHTWGSPTEKSLMLTMRNENTYLHLCPSTNNHRINREEIDVRNQCSYRAMTISKRQGSIAHMDGMLQWKNASCLDQEGVLLFFVRQ